MKITVKTKNHDLTDAVRELIDEKFKSLNKFERDGAAILDCEIEQSIAAVRAGAKYRAEGNLSLDGRLFRAEAMGETLEGAIDTVRNDLARELRATRGKERGLLKRGGAALKKMLRFGR